MLLGGRVAEEIIYGPDSITTGAQNDLEKVTSTARNMVTTYGMSFKMGNMAYGKSEEHVFMGRDFGHSRDYSEEIAAYQMREYDKNDDGQLSLEEYESRFENLTREDRRNIRRNKKNGTYKTPEEQFKEMDKNNDGFVDEQERAEYIRKLRDSGNYLY